VDDYDALEYAIHRKYGIGGEFEPIGTVPFGTTTYTDDLTNEDDGDYWYAITTVDYYEAHSEMSDQYYIPVGLLPPTTSSATSGLDGHVLVSWVPPGVFSYEEDFEDNNGEYTEEGGGWQWGAPDYANGPPGAYSGENVWGTNLTGDYINSANWTLSSIPITIAGSVPHMTYWAWYSIENSWDGWNIKISIDGGATWVILDPVGGYPDDSIVGLGEPGFTGNSGGWVQHVFDLAGYEGEVMFRWHFGTDSSVNTYPGVYIDDVYVGDIEVALTYVDYEAPDFETYLIQEYGATNDAALIAKAEVSYQEILNRTEIPVVTAMPLSAIRDVTGYSIYRSTESGFEPDPSTFAGSSDDPEILVFEDWGPDLVNLPEGLEYGLANGTTYYFVVTAVYGDEGESAPTLEVEATPVNAPPSVPQNVVASINERIVEVVWDEVEDYDALEYAVHRKYGIGGEFEQIGTVPFGITTYTDALT
ncbi:MAG: hypothetical protein GY869_01020, partial [Planctomycetes bacterium]|nr:hypothetical protein [Planctomycetota bacterium]